MKDKALYFSGWLLLVATGFGLGEGVTLGLTNARPTVTTPKEDAGRVVRVVDGDTYDVLAGGVVYLVRLLGVDAPELDQPFGHQAGDSVARLLRPERPVLLGRRGVDLYGRTLASIKLPVAGSTLPHEKSDIKTGRLDICSSSTPKTPSSREAVPR